MMQPAFNKHRVDEHCRFGTHAVEAKRLWYPLMDPPEQDCDGCGDTLDRDDECACGCCVSDEGEPLVDERWHASCCPCANGASLHGSPCRQPGCVSLERSEAA